MPTARSASFTASSMCGLMTAVTSCNAFSLVQPMVTERAAP
jgi:hypothetical protein